MANDLGKNMRRSVLEFLQDELKEPGSYRVRGYELYHHLGKGLTPNEFKAHLDYLEERRMVEKEPKQAPKVDTKAEELEIAWYSITPYGIDILGRSTTAEIFDWPAPVLCTTC